MIKVIFFFPDAETPELIRRVWDVGVQGWDIADPASCRQGDLNNCSLSVCLVSFVCGDGIAARIKSVHS